jgi:UDP-3-O-acyl-N-acetylglucosamine deacetylase
MLYTKTLGKLFADTRNLGYNWKNILVAGKKRYLNKPTLLHQGKSLEAAWHRACLDLLAALSMLESGRLAGRISSYKAGHLLDARLMSQLYLQDLLVETR